MCICLCVMLVCKCFVRLFACTGQHDSVCLKSCVTHLFYTKQSAICVLHSHASDCMLINTMYADLMEAIKDDKLSVDGWSFRFLINMQLFFFSSRLL